MTTVRAAAVQLSPVLYSRDGTVERVVANIDELATRGVQFAAFPETVVPYYPYFSFVQRPYEMLAEQTRSGGWREGVVCVVLGRGASTEKVEEWLRAAAPVEGFVGFAIGRSIWWDALKAFLGKDLDREAAAEQIAENYLRFTRVYEGQAVH